MRVTIADGNGATTLAVKLLESPNVLQNDHMNHGHHKFSTKNKMVHSNVLFNFQNLSFGRESVGEDKLDLLLLSSAAIAFECDAHVSSVRTGLSSKGEQADRW